MARTVRVPQGLVPALVVLCAGLGVGAARLFAVPSVVVDYGPLPGGPLRTSAFVVDGVRCVDTAARAAEQLRGQPGVVRLVAFASRSRLDITFATAQTAVDRLREALEGPVLDRPSGEYLFHVFRVVQVDGIDVAPRIGTE